MEKIFSLRKYALYISLMFFVLSIGFIFVKAGKDLFEGRIWLSCEACSDDDIVLRLNYGDNSETEFTTEKFVQYLRGYDYRVVNLPFYNADYLSLNFSPGKETVNIRKAEILLGSGSLEMTNEFLSTPVKAKDIKEIKKSDDGISISYDGDAPGVTYDISSFGLDQEYKKFNKNRDRLYLSFQILIVVVFTAVIFLFLRNMGHVFSCEKTKSFSLTYMERLIVLGIFLICLMGSCFLSSIYCPDEYARNLVTDYIYKTGKLPTGYTKETFIYGWGFSYAYRPYLSAIIGALFMKLASFFTESADVLRVMSRLCSALSITGSGYFLLKTGKRLFKRQISGIVLCVMVCFVPQVMFLGMYQNNDALSLLFVCMELYFLVCGLSTNWSVRSCIGLAFAISVGLLSYYSVYGWILSGALLFVITALGNDKINVKVRELLPRVFMMLTIIMLLAGWFFIRNGVVQNGDFLGIKTEGITRQMLSQEGKTVYTYNSPADKGVSLSSFIAEDNDNYRYRDYTLKSMIGYFGHMDIPLGKKTYYMYYILMMAVITGFIIPGRQLKKDAAFKCIMIFVVFSSLITIGLSFFQSYFRDFEPQGRYIITVWIMISLCASGTAETLAEIGEKKDESVKIILNLTPVLICIIWILLFIHVWYEKMILMII